MLTPSPGSAARLATALAIAVIVAGCASAGTPQSAAPGSAAPSGPASGSINASPPPPPEPRNAWERALFDTDDHGDYTTDAALRLFATAFGPLPGVDVQADVTGIHDRTVAIDAVRRHWAELSAAQRTAVEAAIATPEGAKHLSIPPASGLLTTAALEQPSDGRSARIQQAVDSTASLVTEWAPKFRQEIAGHIGFDVPGVIDLAYDVPTLTPVGNPKGVVYGDAEPSWPGGTFGQCHLNLYSSVNEEDTAGILDTLAHELFHCFQFAGYGGLAAYTQAPRWVLEGQADWVGGTLTDGASSLEGGDWYWYLKWPQQSLFKRSYDAIGFYEHLKETGTDPWTIFRPMWNAGGDNIAIFRAANADREDFYDSWASSVLRDPTRGPAWTTDGRPGAQPTAAYQPIFIGISDGMTAEIGTAYATNDIRVFDIAADFVHIAVEGHGRLSDGAIDTTDLGDVTFCVVGHQCTSSCPNGDQAPPTAGTIAPEFALAMSGALDGTLATVEAKDLKEACETPHPSATPSEFCQQYRDLLIWWKRNPSTTTVPTKEWSGEIVNRSLAMYHVAPPEMQPWVAIVFRTYATYTDVNVYADIPASGPSAADLPQAGMAMDAYCGIKRNAQGWIQE
jgi:hypothetical protein